MDAYRANGWDGLTPEAQSAINQLKNINTDWNDILFRDAFTQEYNFSISGGSENVTYYNSLGYSKEDGNVPGVSMKRFNLTSKTSYQINRMLKIGMSLFANRRKNTDFVADKYGYANPIYYSRTANPYFNPYDSMVTMRMIMIFQIKIFLTRYEASIFLKKEPIQIKKL